MLDEIRNKPKSVRQRYAFWGAAGVTGVVALIWVASLSIRFGSGDFLAPQANETDGAFSQFFSGLKQDIRNAWPDSKQPAADTGTSTAETPPTSPKPAATGTPSGRKVEIGTSSARSVLVGTSSEQNP